MKMRASFRPVFRRLAHGCAAVFALSFLLCLLCGSASAAVQLRTQQLGFQGQGRVGDQLPVRLELSGLPAAANLTLQVAGPDPAGNQCLDTVASAVVQADGNVAFNGLFCVGRLDGVMTLSVIDVKTKEILFSRIVTLTERSHNLVENPEPDSTFKTLRHTALCTLAVGNPAGLREYEATSLAAQGNEVTAAVFSVAEDAFLPDSRFGYDSVDVVLLNGRVNLNENQLRGLREWVLTGGRLIIHSGATVSSLVQSDLGKWLHAEFEMAAEPVSIRDMSALQSFVPGAVQLQTNRRNVPMARLLSTQVQVAVPSIDGPLIAHRSVGAGIVTFVAVDLDQRPLDNWSSLPGMYEQLLAGRRSDKSPSGRQRSRISSSGVNDLATQMGAAVDAIPPYERWSTWQIMSLIAVLVVVVGPLDYALVAFVLKRPALTWLSFPLWIALACGFIVRQSSEKSGEALTGRQIHLLDVVGTKDGEVQHLRTWTSISSADTRRADIQTQPAFAEKDSPATAVALSSQFRWFGRAEDVYGGMYRDSGAGLGRERYLRNVSVDATDAGFYSMPMLASGSLCYFADSLRDSSNKKLFDTDLQVTGTGLLEGDLKSNLPCDLSNWLVVYSSRVYLPDPKGPPEERVIRPGQVWNRRTRSVRAADLRTFLTGARIQKVQAETETGNKPKFLGSTAYDPRGRDPLDMFLMMSLYEMAGSDAYTGLNHHQLRRLDVSDSVRMNTALLMGIIEPPLSTVTVDQQTLNPVATSTVLRLLIPVSRQQVVNPDQLDPLKADVPETR